MPVHDSADVVIIGAGAAGLAAGRTLAGSGKRVIIIEARDRIGGRIFTRHAPAPGNATLSVELGAEFIHGLPASSWSLLREAQLASIELQGEHFCFDEGQLRICGEEQRDAFETLQRMEVWLERLPAGGDATFEEYLRAAGISAVAGERAAAFVEGFNAADRKVISATALVRQQRAEDQVQGDRIFHIRPGYDSLPDYLGQELMRVGARIMLASPVRRIRWSKGSVSVQGRSATGLEFCIDAPQAVVTLPLGVLHADSVAFDPAPLDMARHWQSLVMGQAQRVTLVFDQPFWSVAAPALSFLFARGEMIPTWWTRMPECTPIITGWAAGAKTMAQWQEANITDPVAVETLALDTLAKIFGRTRRELRSRLVSSHYHDWQRDEYSRGAYSYVGAGGLDTARSLSVPLDDTLFFAGEHTDLGDQWGTVHAALSSGQRVAQQILDHPPRRS